MKRIVSTLVISMFAVYLSGCLMTRDEIRQDVKPDPPTPQQVQQADAENQLQELDSQNRSLADRVDTLEHNLADLKTDKDNTASQLDARIKTLEDSSKIYEQELTKLDSEYLDQEQKLEALRSSVDELTQKLHSRKSSATKNVYQTASSYFSKKNWKEALIYFDKYRDKNPKGKYYGEATYKMGVAFYELGKKTDARAFYSEAAQKFSKSEWGKKAAKKLKSFK